MLTATGQKETRLENEAALKTSSRAGFFFALEEIIIDRIEEIACNYWTWKSTRSDFPAVYHANLEGMKWRGCNVDHGRVMLDRIEQHHWLVSINYKTI